MLTFEVLKLALPPDTPDEDVIELMKVGISHTLLLYFEKGRQNWYDDDVLLQ